MDTLREAQFSSKLWSCLLISVSYSDIYTAVRIGGHLLRQFLDGHLLLTGLCMKPGSRSRMYKPKLST